jgi:hypothetical protein
LKDLTFRDIGVDVDNSESSEVRKPMLGIPKIGPGTLAGAYIDYPMKNSK